MDEKEINISGITESLSESISDQQFVIKKTKLENPLANKKVAISVSACEGLSTIGLSEHHVKDISIELARYLFVGGATLLYGGDLRQGGFTEIFADLSYQYKYLKDREVRFVNYFPFPTSKKINLDTQADYFKKQVEPRVLDLPAHIKNIDINKEYSARIVEERYVIAECLKDMRETMANDSDARVSLGGMQSGFTGYYPGILEEAYFTLKAGKPLYLLGGFGGATRSIVTLIQGGKPEQLTNEFQFHSEESKKFKEYVDKKGGFNYDYSEKVDYFKQFTTRMIAESNGLSNEENQVLFSSVNIQEIIMLILKGLKNQKS